MKTFICDFEAYQLGNAGTYYPLEIALLNCDTKTCEMFYVKYLQNIHDLTTQFQFKRHGIGWKDGNEFLEQAFYKMNSLVSYNDIIYVKGLEKTKYIREWFPLVVVIEILNAPSLMEIKTDVSFTCHKHNPKLYLACAKRKAYSLLPYVCV